jgi:hypothetical protein
MNVTSSISFVMAKVKSHIRMAILKSRICKAMAILKGRTCRNVGPGRLLVVTAARAQNGKEETRKEFENFTKRSVPVNWNTLSPVQKYNRVLAIYKRLRPVERMTA